ncbi:MAG: hypothetical protein J6B96_07735 [Agathobacter sp.]|nr:hypothetical protein [Agathobacter sp.]
MKRKITIQQILAALVGIFCVSVGVAFNNCAGWGNDAIGMLYDGIRVAFGMTSEQLGMASNVVNISLTVLLFLLARKYVSIGTFVYLLPYGFFVSIGTTLYPMIFASEMTLVRILGSVVGCVLLCFGVAIYIVLDIGVDPFTGIVLFFADITKKEYRIIKIIFDLTLIVIGAILGGQLGAVTLITAIAVGPTIQFFAGLIRRWRWFMVHIKGEC